MAAGRRLAHAEARGEVALCGREQDKSARNRPAQATERRGGEAASVSSSASEARSTREDTTE